jgi:hypothetical protein
MNIFRIAGKFLDQPILVAKFEKSVPFLLSTGGALQVAHSTKRSPKEERNKTFKRNGITMLFTIASALAAPKIVNKVFNKNMPGLIEVKKNNTEIISKLLKENKFCKTNEKILNKAKSKILNFKEIKLLEQSHKDILEKLIPAPENITSKEIFSEIGRLSLLGFIPVLGGIAGGILGDYMTSNTWQKKIPNKIKEGTYQYLANIFLCNIGAGAALGILEKMGIKSKSARALGMISGIILTGIIGGSAIANFIGNNLVNPLFGHKKQNGIYSERKPEAIDIGLHIDDIATVAVMSGLKWIEPALPIMYSISGYRAGIGYRNVTNCKEKKEP